MTRLDNPQYGYIVPSGAKNRIRVVFDDSDSMSGQKLEDAQIGVEEFLRACKLNETAVAVHPMNGPALDLTADLPTLAMSTHGIVSQGGTPMFQTLTQAQYASPKATRFILFSDGAPTDSGKEGCIGTAILAKTPIDTVLIWGGGAGVERTSQYTLLKEMADKTGGIFLVFDRTKVNFQDAFKYLSPGLRLALSDGQFRADLQNGKVR
jgi:uncharacterized protein YegL